MKLRWETYRQGRKIHVLRDEKWLYLLFTGGRRFAWLATVYAAKKVSRTRTWRYRVRIFS